MILVVYCVRSVICFKLSNFKYCVGGRSFKFLVSLEERDQSKDEGVDERIILKWIFQKWNGDMELIDLAQNRDRY